MLPKPYRDLTTDQKLSLVEELWESIAKDTKMDLTQAQKEMLDKREEQIHDKSVKRLTWLEVKKKLKSRRKA